MNEELYKENILDHYKHPRNKRTIDGARTGRGGNASCGDSVTFYLKTENGKVTDASFKGEGCAISQSGVSMLTEKIKGMSLNEIKTITPGDIYNMLGVKISPGRVNCALLGYESMNKALKEDA